ncbi:MAG: hypothetical protein SVR94_06490 [Pseudomonadota bacterium]|nr:hypothetical protein [Pseudomonadota bacterium]
MKPTIRISNHLKNTAVIALILLPVFYFISYNLLLSYVGGDQAYYRDYYSALKDKPISDIPKITKKYINANEPFSGFILWAGSNLDIQKDVYISILNLFLLLGVFLLARKNNVKAPVIVLLLTNFYILVLLTSAERLKIAYIFIVFSALFAGKARWALASISPFSHLQSLLLFPSLFMRNLESELRRLFSYFVIRKRIIFQVFFISCTALIIFLFLGEGIVRKGIIYASKDKSPVELASLVLLSVVALFVSINRSRMLLLILPLYPFVIILGGDRVNMMAVTLVIYQLMIEGRMHHPLIYLLLVYFSSKSIPFVNNIIIHGNGFA